LQTSSPLIVLEDKKIIIKKENKSYLKITVTPSTAGLVKEFIYLPNGKVI
jgi:hypothetical protein